MITILALLLASGQADRNNPTQNDGLFAEGKCVFDQLTLHGKNQLEDARSACEKLYRWSEEQTHYATGIAYSTVQSATALRELQGRGVDRIQADHVTRDFSERDTLILGTPNTAEYPEGLEVLKRLTKNISETGLKIEDRKALGRAVRFRASVSWN